MTREIHIRPVLNGFIVTVGCRTVVFTDPAKLADELLRYYRAPEETEKDYLGKAINKGGEPQCDQAEAPPCPPPSTLGQAAERRR